MGRWTLRHTDEVLVNKLEAIINGAIRRSREESDTKAKTTLSYADFVETLDEEDTFTTTVIEILLKELADRRMRPTAEDRRLISQQTSEGLHSLAVMSGTYHPTLPYNRFRNRSAVNLNGPSAPLYTPADSDEDEMGVGDGMGGIEGARIDSALYDVYNGSGQPYPPAPALSSTGRTDDSAPIYRHYEGASIPGRHLPVPHSHFIPASSRRWTSVFGSGSGGAGSVNNNPSANATSLVRRHSIYRPVQRHVRVPMPEGFTQATSDFSEFAARRRSSQRQHQIRDRAIADGMQPRVSAIRVAELQPRPSHDLPRAALFDPPSPSARDSGTRVPSPSPSTEGDDAQGGRTPRASQAYPLLRESREDMDYAFFGGTLSDWHPVPPRIPLRRGGVQPPETMLPPADSILPPDLDPLTRDPGMPSLLRPEVDDDFERAFGRWFTNERASLDRQQETSPSSVPPQEAPASLPTPRSVSPTEENAPARSRPNETAH